MLLVSPTYAKRVNQQRLMHQWLTRPPPGRSGTPLEVLLPADSMFLSLPQPVIVAIKSTRSSLSAYIAHKCRDSAFEASRRY
jgi:hypothetical protein